MIKPAQRETPHKRYPLQVILSFSFALFTLGAISIVAILNALSTYDFARSNLHHDVSAAAEIATVRVDGYIGEIVAAMKASASGQSKRLFDDIEEVRHSALLKILASHASIRDVWSVDIDGKPVDFVSRFEIEAGKGLANLWSPEQNKLTQNRETYFSEVQFTRVSQEPLIAVAVPLSKIGTAESGFIVANLSLKYLWNLLTNLRSNDLRDAYAFNNAGTLIGHSNKSLVFSETILSQEVLNLAFNSRGTGSLEVTTYDNQDVVVGTSLIDRLGFGVAVEAPIKEALDKAYLGIMDLIVVSAGTAISALVFSFFLAKYISTPLQRLSDAAEEVSDTNFSLAPDIHGTLETYKLNVTINKMAKRLVETIAELKEQIGKRKKTEITLRQNEERFRRLFQNAEISIWNEDFSEVIKELQSFRNNGVTDLTRYFDENENAVWDILEKVKIVQVNNATLKLFGATSEEMFVTQIDKIFGLNAIEIFKKELCAIWNNDESFLSEGNFKSLDGREITAMITFQIPNTDDGFKSIPVSIIDISDRKIAESELIEREKRYRSVVTTARDGFLLVDRSGKILDANEAYIQISGYSRKELLSMTIPDLEVVETKSAVDAHIKKIIEFGSDLFESVHRTKSGGKWQVEVSASFLDIDDGRFFSFFRDITHRKELERSLRNALTEAKRANEAKSEFLASMSHELRTPMNAVLGFAQMLQFDPESPLSTKQNEHVMSIMEGGKHLLELINEVLDLAKVEAHQINLSLEELPASDVVEECTALAAHLGTKRNVIITNNINIETSAVLLTDRQRFKQILINLLSNAIKYNTDNGAVTVDGQIVNGGFFRISVADTGIGIAKSDYSSLFQMFHRLGADSMKAKEGTGIGLRVSKLLIESMAGQIGLHSEEGVGSTFWFDLPLASNSEILIWDDNLRIGIDAIDKDHQTIVSLINKTAHIAITDPEFSETIESLIDFIFLHFKREEKVMEVCGYPELEQHRKIHEQLVDHVNSLVAVWHIDQSSENLHQLRKYIRNWVIDHILKVDIKISPYVKGNNQDIQTALQELK